MLFSLETSIEKSWKLINKNVNFDWVRPQHCLLLIGYDDTKNIYYFNDPHEGCRRECDQDIFL